MVNMMQFFPIYGVMASGFPDKSVDGKLEVVKCILEDMSNSVDRDRSVNGIIVDNRFWDDPIKGPGDGK